MGSGGVVTVRSEAEWRDEAYDEYGGSINDGRMDGNDHTSHHPNINDE